VKQGRTYRRAAFIALQIYGIAVYLTVLFLLAIVTIGIWDIYCGVVECGAESSALVSGSSQENQNKVGDENSEGRNIAADNSAHLPVMTILHGLEYLLISPLPYLILTSLAHFIAAWGLGTNVETAAWNIKDQLARQADFKRPKEGFEAEAHTKLSEAKVLLYSTFCGLITLDFIGKVMTNKITAKIGILELVGLFLIGSMMFALKLIFIPHKRQHYRAPGETSGPVQQQGD